MKNQIQVGDVVRSLKGRDKGKLFLVVNVKDGKAETVDGRVRRVIDPKLKNQKHLETVYPMVLKELAEEISKGNPVGNDRVWKAISIVKEKI
jgi:ribosomal protein L14E/L6E/L27E